MGSPVKCRACDRENGLLAESCRGETCGRPITRDGVLRYSQNEYRPFAWETKSITQIIAEGELEAGADAEQPAALTTEEALIKLVAELQPEDNNEAESRDFAVLNAHDFLRYCLLLQKLKSQFEEDDGSIWFDDCLFLLRGGYNFALYLNLMSAPFVCRGRIFGGLAHARRPKERLAAWLKRLIEEANARGRNEIDVFVADEVNAGHSIKGFLNAIFDAVQEIANGRSLAACINFHYYLIINDRTKFDPALFYKNLNHSDPRKIRIAYDKNYILVSNSFRVFQGPLLTYDCDIYSGLKTIKEKGAYEEKYAAIRVPTKHLAIRCPYTSANIWAYGTDDKSRADLLIMETLCGIGPSFYDPMRAQCQLCSELVTSLIGGKDSSKHIHSYRLPVESPNP